jgi:membrane protease YdiL (CAAX protease family)
MMLPILGVGVLLVLFLMLLQTFLSSGFGGDPFAPTSGGAHPIVLDIANGGWQVRILLVALAAIAAPIVEETMFRGVLYRQLRTASNKWGIALSILCSVLLTSFLFAAIHPQGWVAIPALMAIAIGMNIMREWRGTLLPSMVVHGVSNAIVTSIMIIFLS